MKPLHVSLTFLNRLHHWLKDEHAVGLDFSDGHIAAAHFATHKGKLLLDALATETIGTGLSQKEQAQHLHAFWRKNNLPTRTVCTSLHSSSLIVRSFSYTNIIKEELKNVLTLEAEEALQLSADQISYSWQVNLPSEEKKEISGTLIAVPRNIVRDHVKIIQTAGLYPVNIEIACSAVINLHAHIHGNTDPLCLVSLTNRMAGIVILSGGSVWPRIFVSSNQNGWNSNISYLAENIQNALLQYQLKLKGSPVTKLLLSGSEQPEQLAVRLQERVSLPVEVWNPLHSGSIRLTKQLQKKELSRITQTPNLAVGLGLGLHHPRKEL